MALVIATGVVFLFWCQDPLHSVIDPADAVDSFEAADDFLVGNDESTVARDGAYLFQHGGSGHNEALSHLDCLGCQVFTWVFDCLGLLFLLLQLILASDLLVVILDDQVNTESVRAGDHADQTTAEPHLVDHEVFAGNAISSLHLGACARQLNRDVCVDLLAGLDDEVVDYRGVITLRVV